MSQIELGGAKMTTWVVVSSGVTSRDVTVPSDIRLEVESGGVVISATILSGGFEDVEGGGRATGETLSAGAGLQIEDGGQLINAKVTSGASLYLNAGAIAQNVFVSSGAAIDLELSVASGETVDLAQSMVASSMELDGATIRSGALLTPLVDVASGGVLSLGATASVLQTAVAKGGLVEGPGSLFGRTYVSGTISGANIASQTYYYGYAEVFSGGTLSNVSVGPGCIVSADDGGRTIGLQLQGGGSVEYVNGGGAAFRTTVHGGGVLVASSGARLSGDVVMSGGVISTLNATEAMSGVTLESGAKAFNDYVFSNNATVSDLTIESGCYINLVSASATGIVVSGGGVENVAYFGSDTGTVLVGSSGAELPAGDENDTGFAYQFVDQAKVHKTLIERGGFQEIDGRRSFAENSVVENGGAVRIDSGGSLVGARLEAGSELVVESGYSRIRGLRLLPGAKIDLAHQIATGASVVSGQLVASSGATVIDTLSLAGDTASLSFTVASDGAGGTDIKVSRAAAAQTSTPAPVAGRPAALVEAVAGFAAGGAMLLDAKLRWAGSDFRGGAFLGATKGAVRLA